MTAAAIVSALILLNALFVAAEFAIVGSSRHRIERMAREGDRLAGMVHHVLGDARRQDRYIATAQLGITSASLALGMYGEHALAEWLALRLDALGALREASAHAIASVAAIVFLTYLHVVLGEMVPKSLALQAPSRSARVIALPMRITELALFPLVAALNGIGNGVLRLLGVERSVSGEESYRTVDELSFIVAESRAEGLLGREPARVIQELLEFGDLTAGEVMVPRTRVTAFAMGASRDEVARTLGEAPHTRYPVHDGDLDHVVGVVHVKELLKELEEGRRLEPSMVRSMPFVPATETLDRVLARMRSSRSHMAVVIDEHGGTAGVLTLEDLFEEVVGEMADPGETPAVTEDEDGCMSVSGTLRLDELGEELGLVLEHQEVDTVSGLIISKLGRPPVVGDRAEHEGVVFQVSAVRGRGVEAARVLSAPEPE